MKNFSIFVFKTLKRVSSPNIMDQSNADRDAEREAIRTEIIKFCRRLNGTDSDAYDAVYKKGMERIADMYNFPEEKLKSIGYSLGFPKGKKTVTITPVPVEEIEANIDGIISNTYNKVEGEFENMDFVYQLWRQKFIDGNGTIWLSKDDINEAIRLCDSAIADKYHPEQYLPQEDGDYGKKYISDVRLFRMTCKHLLKLMNKKYEIYSIIWQKKS